MTCTCPLGRSSRGAKLAQALALALVLVLVLALAQEPVRERALAWVQALERVPQAEVALLPMVVPCRVGLNFHLHHKPQPSQKWKQLHP